MFAIIPSLLSLLTAHNTAGSGYIGVAKVKKYREVSRLIAGTKTERSIVKFVAAVRIHTSFIWALGHDDETSTFPVLLVQSTKSPQA